MTTHGLPARNAESTAPNTGLDGQRHADERRCLRRAVHHHGRHTGVDEVGDEPRSEEQPIGPPQRQPDRGVDADADDGCDTLRLPPTAGGEEERPDTCPIGQVEPGTLRHGAEKLPPSRIG